MKEGDVSLLGIDDFRDLFDPLLEKGEVICVHGPSGCGKSCMTREILSDYTFVEFDFSILKSRKTTLEFFEKIKGSSSVLFFDDVDLSTQGWKYMHEIIKERKCVTGPVVLVSREKEKIESMFCSEEIDFLEVPKQTLENLKNFGRNFLKNQNTNVLEMWNGNMRNYVISLGCMRDFNLKVSKPDEFFTTQDSVRDLICHGGKGYSRFVGQGIEEHGHMQDVIFSNFKTESIEKYLKIIESISRSDIYDNQIYMGNWDFLPYFTLDACVVPSIHSDKCSEIKPGTVWTKCYNQKMRQKNLENFFARNPELKNDISFFSFLSRILKNKSVDGSLKILNNYSFIPSDLDLMNHITIKTKLKGKSLNTLKRALKNATTYGRHQGKRGDG